MTRLMDDCIQPYCEEWGWKEKGKLKVVDVRFPLVWMEGSITHSTYFFELMLLHLFSCDTPSDVGKRFLHVFILIFFYIIFYVEFLLI